MKTCLQNSSDESKILKGDYASHIHNSLYS